MQIGQIGCLFPALYMMREGEQSVKVALQLTTASQSMAVRITGGCGLLEAQHAEVMLDNLTQAFRGFGGALLCGGTRIVDRNDIAKVVTGIGEIPPAIRINNPGVRCLGVVPLADQDMRLMPSLGVLVHATEDQLTIVHPMQDISVIIQQDSDRGVRWEAEYVLCMEITETLRSYAAWSSLLVCYNGGATTEKEILSVAQRGWPVLLINGSGRVTDLYATDQSFLQAHPNVKTCENTAGSIREALVGSGVVLGP